MSALVCEGLAYAYRDGTAIGPVTLSLGVGITALVGPNGAGKTTLMKMLGGQTIPCRGTLTWAGLSVADARARSSLRKVTGYLGQAPVWPAGWRVGEFIEYTARVFGVPRQAIGSAREEALERAGAREFCERRLGTLSGGEQRRVYLAAAIVHSPGLLLLDEPSAGLDPAERVKLRRFLRQVATERTVLVSTHLMDDVALGADRVVVLAQGSVVWQGTVPELEQLGARSDPDLSRAEAGYLRLVQR